MKSNDLRWRIMEAGWYEYRSEFGPTLASISRERDRTWHVYIKRAAPPGDVVCNTLKKAQRAALEILKHDRQT